MTLKEKLKNEDKNDGCIYLYREEDGWYAYEQSAFYCYSLLGMVDVGWLLASPDDVDTLIIRVRISDLDHFLNSPLLKLLTEKDDEYVILCRNSCRGFYYWREEQETKYTFSRQRKNEPLTKENNNVWLGVLLNQNNKTKEMNEVHQKDTPVIEIVYDPLSQRRDGTITPSAPIVVYGHDFLCWPREQVEFCLCPVEELGRLISVKEMYKHTEKQILVTLPELKKGEYHPAFRLKDKKGEEQVYYFPDTWRVRNLTLIEIYSDRRNMQPSMECE